MSTDSLGGTIKRIASMDKSHLVLALAIIDLCLSFVLFTNQQYFSAYAMAGILVLAAFSAALFFLPYTKRAAGRMNLIFIFSLAASLLLIYLEGSWDGASSQQLYAVGSASLLVFTAVAATLAGLYAMGRRMRDLKGKWKYAVFAAAVVAIAAMSYGIMYGLSATNWNAVDEIVYNYYAGSLFMHGINPYTVSMLPMVEQAGVIPTSMLNGTYESSYDYPALSFLSFFPLSTLSLIQFIQSLTFLIILFSVFAAALLYVRSGYDSHVLIPMAVWLAASYALVGVYTTYLAVTVFLFLAYTEKDRMLVSSIFIGLAASVTQLAWFALPFFLILTLKSRGRRGLATQALASFLVFAAINAYFVYESPATVLGSVFGLFGPTKLLFYGPNITQFFIAFYPVSIFYPAFISVIAFIVLIAVFYLYDRELLPLLALVPMFIFFLSWRNIVIYGLSFVPILLAMYYVREKEHAKRKEHRKTSAGYAKIAVSALAIIGIASAVYAHWIYTQQNPISIVNSTPIIYVTGQSQSPNGYSYVLGGILLKAARSESAGTVSFYVASRNPDYEEYFLGQMQANANASNKNVTEGNYTLDYQLPLIDNGTQLFVVAFSDGYITSKHIGLALDYGTYKNATGR